MNTLISKVQYKGFEPGEFTEIANRNLEQTITLIKNYPWEKERHLTPVDLTGPSVSIEDNEGNILKLGTGYYSHYKLYWLKAADKIYIHDVNNLDEAISVITDYYNRKNISEGFKPYKSLSNKKHFVTNDFIYTVTTKRILSYNIVHIFLGLPFIYLIYSSLLNNGKIDLSKGFYPVIFMLVLWFIFSGINLVFSVHYYLRSRNKCLILSKGIPTFYWGDKNNLKQYSKNDIINIKELRYKGNRNPYAYHNLFFINFKDGSCIIIPSLLISDNVFSNKMQKIQRVYIDTSFPWLLPKQ